MAGTSGMMVSERHTQRGGEGERDEFMPYLRAWRGG